MSIDQELQEAIETVLPPDKINTEAHFWNAFGHHEREISANWVVRFCQSRGNWDCFTFRELEKWC